MRDDFFAVLLVLLLSLDWGVAAVLVYVSRVNPTVVTLRERAFAAVICAVIASIATFLAFVRLGTFNVPNEQAIALLALGAVLVSLPAGYWLVLAVLGHFGEAE